MNIRRLDFARLRQSFAERRHRGLVERHGGRKFRQLRAESEIQPQRPLHRLRRKTMKLFCPFRFRMIEVHCGVHPDRAKRKLAPKIHAKASHVVFVLVGYDQQIDVMLAVNRWQERL